MVILRLSDQINSLQSAAFNVVTVLVINVAIQFMRALVRLAREPVLSFLVPGSAMVNIAPLFELFSINDFFCRIFSIELLHDLLIFI